MRVGESPKLKLEVTCAVSHAKDYGRFPLSPGVWVRNQMKGSRNHLFGLSGILRTILEGGPFYPVLLVGPKCPFPAFDKILSPVPLSFILLTSTILADIGESLVV